MVSRELHCRKWSSEEVVLDDNVLELILSQSFNSCHAYK